MVFMCTSPERTRPFSWCSIGLENDTSHARYRYITNATLDIISQCAFGQDVHAQSPDGEQQPAYVQAVNEQTELIFDRVLKPWYVCATMPSRAACRSLFCRSPANVTATRLYSNRIYYNLTPSGRRAKQALKVLHSYTRSVINKCDSRTAHVACSLWIHHVFTCVFCLPASGARPIWLLERSPPAPATSWIRCC